MATILLEGRAAPRISPDRRLKRSFFASVIIHASLLLVLIIAASIPSKFHFEQTALIELGIPATSSTLSGGTPAEKSAGKSPVQIKGPRIASPIVTKSPKVLALKPKASITPHAVKTNTLVEKISLKGSKEAKALQPDLKDRILQKWSAMGAAQGSGTPQASSASEAPAGQAPNGLQGIGTDVPFPFMSYLADIQDRITQSWEEPGWLAAKAAGSKAIVVFRIHRDGSVTRVLLAIPSGLAALDTSAIQAVESASPLPPLPSEFKNDFLDVHLQFDLLQ